MSDKISKLSFKTLYRYLLKASKPVAEEGDAALLRKIISKCAESTPIKADKFGNNPLLHDMSTATALCERISPDRNMIIAIMLRGPVDSGALMMDEVQKYWGEDVVKLLNGLGNINALYRRQVAVQSDNFRHLLMNFADDIRVIIIMIIDRLQLMKRINHHPNEKLVREVALEVNFLYAPLAHRLGLYSIKGELEDMSLKYTNRKVFDDIKNHLNQTKTSRDAYITDFITPVKEKLQAAGIKFDIKGRTKSIYSIWNKLVKQKTDIDHIYDLFAIRIIIDTDLDNEKAQCWLAYSLITDMYQPNPARMKDWISVPKSNGYESLHITVAGPGGRWVEVQIRTRRMDLVAEKGLAAHWRYKGIKSDNSTLDSWMNNVRDIFEAGSAGPMELMRNFRMDFYDKEVFVFTPKGDLYKLPLGATVLDFAFNIHSHLGCQCTGALVNGKNQKLNYRLVSGDTVEIITSSNQSPNRDWLNFVITSKARNKIRQTLNEQSNQGSELAKELLMRRFKNRKIEVDEALLMKTIKKLGYKTVTDFYNAIFAETLDVNSVIEAYEQQVSKDKAPDTAVRSAEEFVLQTFEPTEQKRNTDVLIIGNNIKGINYRLSKCCNPIHGDDVFGFISSEGVVKIHRTDCPNAMNMRERYPHRIINTQWSGKIGDQFAATLRVLGNDDIGIVTNITSIINKEKDCTLRSISIDSNDGLFQGHLVVGVNDTGSLKSIIKKIATVKGVKNVERER